MATSKTLTPTNVTIQIPAMTDAPDQSVNSNCIDKLGDAVNALNSHLTWTRLTEQTTTANTAYDSTITIPNVNNYNEIMLSLQRASNGRTFATTVVPVSQFLGGAVYSLGSYSIFSGNLDQQNAIVVNAVAIYVSDTQVEIAMNSLSEPVKIRLYGR